MDTRRVGAVLFVGGIAVAAAFSTLHARQATDRAAFTSLQIVLPVTDIRESVEFYRTVLEFESAKVLPTVRGDSLIASANALPTPPSRVTLSVGGQYLGLQQGLKEGLRPDGIQLVVHVANPGEYATRLRARGAAVNVEITGMDRQPLAFTVMDPDGYRFYFTGNAVPAGR